MFDFLKKLFTTPSGWDQYTLVKNIRNWQDSQTLPLWSGLPGSFRLSTEFWDNALRIYRYTTQTGKENAISLWSIYKQVIITDVTQGDEQQVVTRDRIQVKFLAIKGKNAYTRVVYVNGKERNRTTIPYDQIPKTQKDAEIRFLFNVHTHPPHKVVNMVENKLYYSYFSHTDIKTLLESSAPALGMISDKITILIKTRNTPTTVGLPEDKHPDEDYIRDKLRIAEYVADFHTKNFIRKQAPGAME